MGIDNEWIEWNGGEAPDLPVKTRVQVRFRDGEENAGGSGSTVGYWMDPDPSWSNWQHHDCESDIIAYRLVSK